MSGQISRPLGSIALVATLLMSGVGVTVRCTRGRMNVLPRRILLHRREATGTTDWIGQRSVSAGTCVRPACRRNKRLRRLHWRGLPHCIRCQAPRTGSKSAQAITSTTDKLVQRSENEGNTAPSVLEAPAPQASTSSQTSPEAPAAPEAWPDAAPAVAALNAPAPIAVPTDAPADVVSLMQRGLPRATSRPRTPGCR